MIYVDAAIHPWKGKRWCHLFSEDLDKLHRFAARLGLRSSWFQQPPKASWPHYDITEAKRAKALIMGATPACHAETLLVAGRLNGTLTPEREAWLHEVWLAEMLR